MRSIQLRCRMQTSSACKAENIFLVFPSLSYLQHCVLLLRTLSCTRNKVLALPINQAIRKRMNNPNPLRGKPPVPQRFAAGSTDVALQPQLFPTVTFY